jgi:hypothetical protein
MVVELPVTSTNGSTRLRPKRPHSVRSRSLLFKSIRRFLRSVINRPWSRFEVRRNWRRVAAGLACALVLIHVTILVARSLEAAFFASGEEPIGAAREAQHFSRKTHYFLPRQRTVDEADLSPCSWLYLEVNARDGTDLDAFFENGNGIFEETLRAELSFARGFCAVALEPNIAHSSALLAVRRLRAQYTKRFDVFPGVYARSGVQPLPAPVTDSIIDLPEFVRQLTFPLHLSILQRADRMVFARANGHPGTVILRISGSVPELYAHVDALHQRGVLCDRVDRLWLNVTANTRDPDQTTGAESLAGAYKGGLDLVLNVARQFDRFAKCRTRVFITAASGDLVFPEPLDSRALTYAVLAGAPTFKKRVAAQVGSWLQAVPKDLVTFYTNVANDAHADVAKGHNIVVTSPYRPRIEKTLQRMQSWSHLVRVRESWDRYIRDDPAVKWLVLVDDDTFVFPAGMREYLSLLDARIPIWGGSAEQARIDNGDHGEFGLWLRNLSMFHGGKYCYMVKEEVKNETDTEPVSRFISVKGRVFEIKSDELSAPRMCADSFCQRGCPAVPQGAAIVISRALVELLRPVIEQCEVHTSHLCERCGSQRLYMCVNRFVTGRPRTLMTRGICRSPWKVEHRPHFPFALSYHAFERFGRRGLSTSSMATDMQQLWAIGSDYENRTAWHRMVPMQEVADLLGCSGQARYVEETSSCEAFNDSNDLP